MQKGKKLVLVKLLIISLFWVSCKAQTSKECEKDFVTIEHLKRQFDIDRNDPISINLFADTIWGECLTYMIKQPTDEELLNLDNFLLIADLKESQNRLDNFFDKRTRVQISNKLSETESNYFDLYDELIVTIKDNDESDSVCLVIFRRNTKGNLIINCIRGIG